MSDLNDRDWRERAKETRAMAGHVTDPAVKRTMLTIADECTLRNGARIIDKSWPADD